MYIYIYILYRYANITLFIVCLYSVHPMIFHLVGSTIFNSAATPSPGRFRGPSMVGGPRYVRV